MSLLDAVAPRVGRPTSPVDASVGTVRYFSNALRANAYLSRRLEVWGRRGGATLLIPTDFAIVHLEQSDMFLTDEVLQHHIFDGNLTKDVLMNLQSITSWSGETFTVRSSLKANSSTPGAASDTIVVGNNVSHGILLQSDIAVNTGFGAVHVIDRALMTAADIHAATTSTRNTNVAGAESNSDNVVTTESLILITIAVVVMLVIGMVVAVGLYYAKMDKQQSTSSPYAPPSSGVFQSEHQTSRLGRGLSTPNKSFVSPGRSASRIMSPGGRSTRTLSSAGGYLDPAGDIVGGGAWISRNESSVSGFRRPRSPSEDGKSPYLSSIRLQTHPDPKEMQESYLGIGE